MKLQYVFSDILDETGTFRYGIVIGNEAERFFLFMEKDEWVDIYKATTKDPAFQGSHQINKKINGALRTETHFHTKEVENKPTPKRSLWWYLLGLER